MGSYRTTKSFTVVSWALVILWAAAIFFVSAHSGASLDDGTGLLSRIKRVLEIWIAQAVGSDVDVLAPAAHFCEYVVFAVLMVNALRCHMPLRRACVFALVIASCYGVTDEFHQMFVPGRMCDPLDWVVDTCGSALGVFAAYVFLRYRASSDATA